MFDVNSAANCPPLYCTNGFDRSLIRPDVPCPHGVGHGFRACPPCGKDRVKLYLKTSGMQSSLRKVKYEKRTDTSNKTTAKGSDRNL